MASSEEGNLEFLHRQLDTVHELDGLYPKEFHISTEVSEITIIAGC